jgi:LAO/AO transport system kinase
MRRGWRFTPWKTDVLTAADQALVEGVCAGTGAAQRRAVAKAITLLESTRPDDRLRAEAVLDALLPATGRSLRLGISGVPGVGKSTFIEALGLFLIAKGHRVAVLAIDPSSGISGGSILGDKTRMERLSVSPQAFIRPSPSSGMLGGVAERTREAILVCEAAGHDIVIVETVGVGQSEVAVAGMTDVFVLMQLPNAGDDLQAIKRGVMELADLVVINKADLDEAAATRARAQVTSALRLLGRPLLHQREQGTHESTLPHPREQGTHALPRPHQRERAGVRVFDLLHDPPPSLPPFPADAGEGVEHAAHDPTQWQTRVVQLSALRGTGLDEFWACVTQFRDLQAAQGRLQARRQQQSEAWMWERIEAGLRAAFRAHPRVREQLPQLCCEVREGRLAAPLAARQLLDDALGRQSGPASTKKEEPPDA